VPRKVKGRARKERLTVSLSRESARFLRAVRAEERSPSMSALFEKLVADLQSRTEMEQLDKKMTAYYDSLNEAAVQEDRAWGAVSEAALVSHATEEAAGKNRPGLAIVEP
jgi:hypothetical protein